MFYLFRQLVLVLFLTLLSPWSMGQILNMERYRTEGDSINKLAINLNGSLTLNNRSASESNPVNLFGYNFSLHSVYTPKKHAFIFIAHRNFLRINENPFLNFGYIHLRSNFFRKNRLNFESYIQVSDDNFRGLNPRAIVGSNLRYRLMDRDNSELLIGTGVFYEFERWQHPENEDLVDANFIKSNSSFVFRHKFTEAFHLNGVIFYQVGYDSNINRVRNRYSGDINLNSKITKRFSLTNHLNFSFEDRPIVPITRFIFSFRTGINFEL